MTIATPCNARPAPLRDRPVATWHCGHGIGRVRGKHWRCPLLLLATWGLLLPLVAPVAATPAPAASPNHAGLVIQHGDGDLTYALVAFTEPEITGLELLRRSGVGLATLPFGGLGDGVCTIEDHGCPVSACRRLCQNTPNSPYWRLFGQGPDGAWQPFARGASATIVRDGTLHGWSWTPDAPELPAVTLEEVARRAGAPTVTAPGGPWVNSGRVREERDQQDEMLLAGGVVLLLIGSCAAFAARRRRIVV